MEEDKQKELLQLPPEDLIEEVLVRLPVKSLLRFKVVSKSWRSLIKSPSFMERHYLKRSQGELEVLMVSKQHPNNDFGFNFKSMFLNSGSVSLDETPFSFSLGLPWFQVSEGCDGLVCIYDPNTESINVVNPATRWFRRLPPAYIQELTARSNYTHVRRVCGVGLGKARGTRNYKLVWLRNPFVCEVFDFRANTWRYVKVPCNLSYRVFEYKPPVYADGFLYWFTRPCDDGVTKILVFDLHTETFRLIEKYVSRIWTCAL